MRNFEYTYKPIITPIRGIGEYGSLSHAALVIIEDYHYYKMKNFNHYTLQQCLEKVINRQQTVFAYEHAPSYVWWTLELDEDGQPAPSMVHGKLIAYTDQYIYPIEESDILLEHESYLRKWDTIHELGITFGQRFLSRVSCEFHTDYYGETDSYPTNDMLYSSEHPGQVITCTPIPEIESKGIMTKVSCEGYVIAENKPLRKKY